jgi:C1A family cysteine protease
LRNLHGYTLGWRRDLPDFRDQTAATESVHRLLAKSAAVRRGARKTPAKVDLRPWCSRIEDQGRLGACTAHAGVGMLEYFERRTTGKYLNASRLFLYKVARQLGGIRGDEGTTLRDTMKAMVLFGVPPEHYWPYEVDRYDDDPSAFCFSFAQNYQALQYYRLDPSGTSAEQVLAALKQHLAAGFPAMFGFSVYSSMPAPGDGSGAIPLPGRGDSLIGGHAVLAVGYDDSRRIGGEQGALLVRNSWGREWGEEGYGWLPYAYLRHGLAGDFWSMVRAEFVDTDLFK